MAATLPAGDPQGNAQKPAMPALPNDEPNRPLLRVRNLRKHFAVRAKWTSAPLADPNLKAVDGVDFDIWPGEILGVVGESGCGKTTLGHLLTLALEPSSGTIEFNGDRVDRLRGRALRARHRDVQIVFQDPDDSINPRLTVYETVVEPLINYGIAVTREDREARVTKALTDAGLHPARDYFDRFPHELSGGQLQRVAIARAIVIEPRFIVADEPVSMLDVSIRAGVMNLLLDLRDKYGIAYLFITHDMAVARYMSDRIAVMYLGRIVEIGHADDLIANPLHPYTTAMLSAVPDADPDLKHGHAPIKDEAPTPIGLAGGCRFAPRCPKAEARCRAEEPRLQDYGSGHEVACFFPPNAVPITLRGASRPE
ncbi:MAG: ABC transporter ATP-binding protein [Thermoplasmatota archaeon]